MKVFLKKATNNENLIFTAPPSKSYAHRTIILAGLSNKRVTIKNIGKSKDVLSTIDCLKSLGVNLEIVDNNLEIYSFTKKESAVLNCNESGSTLRFLLPVVSALNIKAKFCGSQKLLSRPNDSLIETLNKNGAKIENFSVNGKLDGDNFVIDGSISSQYITGLLLALPIMGKKSTITVIGKKVSEDYILITLDVMKSFGINITVKDNMFIYNGEKITAKNEMTIEGDYSSASFLFSIGAVGGSVAVKGLNKNSCQGDRKILSVLESFGAKVSYFNDNIVVTKDRLNGIEVDCENIPDLAQIIAVIGAFANGKTILKNIERLKYKESDRIKAILDMLTIAKIDCRQINNTIEIVGGKASGGIFDSCNDHRVAMSASILALFCDENSTITNANAVEKSYPNFFNDIKQTEGVVNVIL